MYRICTPHFLVISIMFVLFAGCDDDSTENISAGEGAPKAMIHAPLSTFVGSTVVLDGLASSDPDSDSLSFQWTLMESPEGSGAFISASAETPSITPDLPGAYRVSLTVSDGTHTSPAFIHTLMAFEAPEQTLYVDAQAATGGDGSEGSPFVTIQEAVDQAQSGDTIMVAGGDYLESILIPDTMSLILMGGYAPGNFAVRDTEDYPSHIISQTTTAGISMDFGGNEGETGLLIIDGFTISAGTRGIRIDDQGNGGMLFLTITGNTIQENSGLTSGDDYGGGIFARAVSTIIGNTVTNNSCGKGGGIAAFLQSDDYGVIVSDNLVADNEAFADHGGGIYVAAYRGTISHNIIRNNAVMETYGWAGGLIIDGGIYDGYTDGIFVELFHNIYSGNFAPSSGSALFIDEGANARIHHELIYGNTTSEGYSSGAIYVDGDRGTTRAITLMEHCTVAMNQGGEGSVGQGLFLQGGVEVQVLNSVFWGNQGDTSIDFFVEEGSSLQLSYTLYGGGHEGDGAFTEEESLLDDPLFVDEGGDDFHLRSTAGHFDATAQSWVMDDVHSPGIDSGAPLSEWLREPSPNGSRVNRGAYGNTPEASKSE
ncbi:hypothetical protein KKF84_20580 [Myxococcota bacterium]|nr:hypothetical protein [Myxococcota bacterium]MBU1537722.1 hypothetical protein [Myxococcota bacterium]